MLNKLGGRCPLSWFPLNPLLPGECRRRNIITSIPVHVQKLELQVADAIGNGSTQFVALQVSTRYLITFTSSSAADLGSYKMERLVNLPILSGMDPQYPCSSRKLKVQIMSPSPRIPLWALTVR